MRPLTYKLAYCFILLVGYATANAYSATQVIDHNLEVSLFPEEQTLRVRDRIHLPDDGPLEFTLHTGLDPHIITPGASLTQTGLSVYKTLLRNYQVTLPEGVRDFTLEYGGKIAHEFRTRKESPGRDQKLLSGTISSQGVFLDAGVAWYPFFPGTHQTFSLTVEVPAKWQVVSQGTGPIETTQDGKRKISWHETNPQDDIYLIASPFHYYARTDKPVHSQVYLRQPDKALAERYLDATEHYLELYQELIGPYPYNKFALVENFWETGYGMPSFTLLGSRVIRLPFILHTSYPHEILHNWWGNGVYVDYPSGNWSEGLTAYLADHLLKEQQGKGIEYRRSALQRFADFVRSENDFPLIDFRSRHSTASQSVGYNKSLMLFHMLRRKLGTQKFIAGLRHFYREHLFRLAGYADLQRSFEKVSGEDLGRFFRQWTQRTSAPALEVRDLDIVSIEDGYRLSGVLIQSQRCAPFDLDVPIVVYPEQGQPVKLNIPMVSRARPFAVDLSFKPLRIDIDPWFDLFRQLHPQEAPATLSKLLGADKILFVLPADASKTQLYGYRQLAANWSKGYREASIILDKELSRLPEQTPVWLLGWENHFLEGFLAESDSSQIELQNDRFQVAGQPFSRLKDSLILVNKDKTDGRVIAVIASDNPQALPGLTRKVPHYGKYSYLVFTGDTPDNQLKGQWAVTESPLRHYLTEERPTIEVLRPEPLWPSPAVIDRQRPQD
jgi:hypothetical protein